ncbi:hypothetical protein PR048_024617 [Dryococelus australis]|uniref:Serpin domain-containing protein n=1 Tax=Dryococelus australis TaxID=614101 RepID=A0ABQ9GP19_9NEOP|nr:hypothetical protein PR048_024617 [Dryococelus australis]
MLWRGLTMLVALAATATAAVMVEGVNDTFPANTTSLRGGEGDSSILFETADASPSTGLSPEAWRAQVDRLVSRRLTRLTLQLQKKLREQNEHSTILFSPLSISGALHLLWLGARGRTATELGALLGKSLGLTVDDLLPSIRRINTQLEHGSGGTEIDVANGLFLQYGYPVRTWFANVSQDTFGTEVYGVEFADKGEAATAQINGWVSRKTKGRINKFLHSPLPANTKVLIANAIYFNGEWENPFPQETSFLRPYTIPTESGESEVIKLWMMTNSGDLPYARSEKLNCHVVGLPYKGKQVTMYLVLPIDRGLEALRILERKLTVMDMEELQAATNETPVIISVPRMRILSTFHLRETIEQLGVEALFDPVEADLGLMSPGKQVVSQTFSLDKDNSSSNGLAVEFPGRTRRAAVVANDNPGLFVDDMIHKVEIEVTETGTVASAVTALTVTRDGSRIVLRFDRPFLFFIRHEATGLQLFWGSVVRPVT